MHTLEKFTMHAREAVRKAEKVIMPYFRTDEKTLQTETKIDDDRFSHEYQKSVVTIADQKAEQTIKAYLHKQFPTHGFIGEEEGSDHADAEYVRIIDPIDGTKNFSRGVYGWGILLACEHKGEIIVSVASMPIIGDTIYAYTGGGCFLNKTPCAVSTKSLKEAYVGVARHRYFQQIDAEKELYKLYDACSYYKSTISWEMYHVACGQLDATISVNSKYHDNAPFALLVTEAGGKATTLDGNMFGKKDTSLIVSNGIIHDEIVNIFSKKWKIYKEHN